jgi:hypothetical protein
MGTPKTRPSDFLLGLSIGTPSACALIEREPSTEFGGILHDRAGVRMGCGPAAGVLAEAAHVGGGFADPIVFAAPKFFKDRMRFHTTILPSIRAECNRLADSSLGSPPRVPNAGGFLAFARWRQFQVSR